ncbi:dioxygenase family protein [Luteococcus sp. Sow4_B9]|uniref:dioxygenase family protein n=1 Tax=Luteococcus sp. Sow4_B9 TaxID=3438792 RepID=UPI003F96EF78
MSPSPHANPQRPFPSATEGGASPRDPNAPVPEFEGRPLRRPTEDVEDQGASFDLGTIMSRRRTLGFLGAGVSALTLAACGVSEKASSSASSTSSAASSSPSSTSQSSASASSSSSSEAATEMPTETAGPYPGDGSNGPDVLEESGIERSDLTTSIGSDKAVEGVLMTLTMRVLDMSNGNAPMVGAAVYAWHCDAQGQYSMYSDGVTGETWLRGVQVTGDDGTVTFTSIIPGCYTGRWPHVHFEVFSSIKDITDATNAILTSQIAIPEKQASAAYALDAYAGSAQNLGQVTLATDNVFSDGYEQQLPTIQGSVDKGFTVTIDVPIDPTTEPEAASVGGMTEGAGGAPGVGQPPSGGPGGPGSTNG